MAKSLREELSSMKRRIRCIQCNENNSGIGGIQSIQEGDNIIVDATDPLNPIVSATIPPAVDISMKLDKPTVDGVWVVTKTGTTVGYADASTLGKNISNDNLTWTVDRVQNLNTKKLSFTGGRISVPALELEITAENSIPNKIWTDGVGYYFNNNLGIKKKVAIGSVFTYTPMGNFTISQIRTAMENEGLIFNDCHITINLGSNNYTCTIDIGVSHPYRIFTMDRNGTGSISFLSTRTLNSGVDAITIMNGNEFSRAIIKTGTSVDFLKVRNE